MKRLMKFILALMLSVLIASPCFAWRGQTAPSSAQYLTAQAESGLSNEVVVSADGKSLVTAADKAAMRAFLDLEPNIDYQPYGAAIDTDNTDDLLKDEAGNISAIHEQQDDIYRNYGNDADWQNRFDATNISLVWTTTAFNGSADNVGMYRIVVNDGNGTLDADQMILQIMNYATQIFGLDTEGDLFVHSVTVDRHATPGFSGKDSDCTDSDINFKIYGNATATGTGAENIDLFAQVQVAGTLKTAWQINADGVSNSQPSFQAYDEVQMAVVDWTTDTATGDGKFYFHIGPKLAGLDLVYCHAEVVTAGTTNTTDIQIYNLTQTQDMLSTKITLDTGETGSDTAATPYVINTSNDDVVLNDVIRVDVDAVHTTAAKGLIVTLGFAIP